MIDWKFIKDAIWMTIIVGGGMTFATFLAFAVGETL